MLQLPLKRVPTGEPAILMLGIPAQESQPALQSDAYKELVNKLAWAIGSTYGTTYNNIRTQTRITANEIAGALVQVHGYPRQIGFPN